ncbi:MAG: VWA domain-containing protein [Candidatus Hydrogenedentota bacterium]
MEFYRQEMWFILLIPILCIFIILYGRTKLKDLRNRFANLNTLFKSGYKKPSKTILKPLLLITAMFFISISLLQPQWGTKPETFIIQGLDMMVVFDISVSMLANDVYPDRISFAKQVITDVIDSLGNDRVGLIGFAGKPYYFCPLTVDYEAFKLYLDAMTVQDVPVQGTAMDLSLQLAEEVLEKSEGKYRIILLVSDGEDHSEETMDIGRDLQKKGILIFTVGIGTIEGGPISLSNIGKAGYKKDKKGNVVMSSLNEKLLYEIAETTYGGYFRATQTLETIDLLKKELSLLKRGKIKEEKVTRKKDRFQIPLFIGIILISLEFLLIERGIEDEE